jgi:HD-like signal output (HDOD) protein
MPHSPPPAPPPTSFDDEAPPAALQRLLDELQRDQGVPGLGSTISGLQRLTRDHSARTQALAALIDDDPGLAAQLLRVANAVHCRSVTDEPVATVHRAVAVMGFDTVQRLALTVALLDRLPRNAAGRRLREQFLAAIVAGRLAAALWPDPRTAEPAQLTALFQNLGRLLLAACLPEEARRLDVPVDPGWAVRWQRETAQLGLPCAGLGAAVARSWNWPAALLQAMAREPWPERAPRETAARLRWLGWTANDLAAVLLHADPPAWDACCATLAQACGAATGCTAPALRAALVAVRPDLPELAASVGLDTGRPAAGGAPKDAAPAAAQAPAPARRAAPAQAPAASGPAPAAPAPVAAAALAQGSGGGSDRALLARETLRLNAALLSKQSRAQVPAQALDALWRGLQARRAVLCLPSAPAAALRPALVLGQPLSPALRDGWQVRPGAGRDLFSALCAQGGQALIGDARRPELARQLPADFRRQGGGRHFLLLPVRADERPLGLIYLDREDDDPFVLDGDELQLVRALSDQTALALLLDAAA